MTETSEPKIELIQKIMSAIKDAKKAGVESPEKLITDIFKAKLDLEDLKNKEKLKRELDKLK